MNMRPDHRGGGNGNGTGRATVLDASIWLSNGLSGSCKVCLGCSEILPTWVGVVDCKKGATQIEAVNKVAMMRAAMRR